MKKCMLVGAVGLALAGVAFAASGEAPRRSANTFASAQKAAVGTVGSAKRAEVLAQLRAGIASGDIDPRTVLFLIDENILPGSGSAVDLSGAGASTEGVVSPNNLFMDPFETYTFTNFTAPPASLISINGQVNPAGIAYQATLRFGVANDQVMIEGDIDPFTAPIVPAGVAPAPAVNVGVGMGIDNLPPYMVLGLGSGQQAPEPGFLLAMNIIHQLSVPGGTPATDTRIKADWYLTNKKTSQAYSPVSFAEGFVMDRMFFGGQNMSGSLGFFNDAGGFLTNFVTLGNLAGNFQIGQFYGPPRSALFPFPVGEWFEVMEMFLSQSGGIGQGAFIKTPESVANGFLDPNMASGAILPVDNEPAGWINTYPGRVDTFVSAADPVFNVHTGLGIATTQFGDTAPTSGPGGLASIFAAISLSGAQIFRGLDDVTDPLFTPDDAFMDDLVLAGGLFVKPCPIPDFIIPYTDDMELYFSGPVRVETDRIFDSISSNAIISTLQNSTVGGAQSLAQLNTNNDNIFREEFAENFPSFPQPVLGSVGTDGVAFTNDADGSEASLTVTANVRIGVTVRTGRALRITDGVTTGNFVGTIIFGATDPRAGLSASDGKIWIRQPNIGSDGVWAVAPGFDETVEGQDAFTQGNWMPASQWSVVPSILAAGESDFNNQFTNIPTGALANGSDGIAVVSNSFTSVLVEVQPNPGQDPKNPADEGLMRITINGAIVPNAARADGLWLAGGASATDAEFWSSNNQLGLGDTIHTDDITLSGPLRVVPAGPAFTAPYSDGFELYNLGENIGGQGSTPFINLGSLADTPANDNARKLTISTLPPTPIVAGTMVCRYTVDLLKFPAGPLTVGDTVVLNYGDLPLPFNAILPQNINCPGVSGTPTPFVIRPFNGTISSAENQPRVQAGNWTLLNTQAGPPATQNPEAYVPVATDNILLSYSTTTGARWGGSGSASLIVNDPTGSGMGQVLQVKSLFGIDGSLTNNPDFGAATALLPQVDAVPGALGVNSVIAALGCDFYIESLDAAGNPANLAPRSRMSIPVFGAGADSGRITTINFGGPNVNNDQTLQGPPVVAPIIPADMISFAVPSGLLSPDTNFVSTGVSLVNGGLGLPSLLNSWWHIYIKIEWIHAFGAPGASTWECFIGPAGGGGPMTLIASGTAIDEGLPGISGPGTVVNTSGLDFFDIRQGLDVGSGGEPTPNNFRVRTLVNNAVVVNPQTSSANVTAPSNADKDADYCFYETTQAPEFQIGIPLNAQIADEGLVTDVFDAPRDLGPNQDVIAVVNRAYNSATNTVSGPPLFNPCPLNVTSPINRFDLYDGPTPANGILYTGRWGLLFSRTTGNLQQFQNNPPPAGGLGRIDGPARIPPVSYNDFTVEPAGFPASVASRPIIVAQWGSDAADNANGVDGFGTVFPRSRWFFDNISLRAIPGAAVCADLDPGNGQNAVGASDLSVLLGNWTTPANPVPAAGDLNGDGIVSAGDLSILLGNWGPCPVAP